MNLIRKLLGQINRATLTDAALLAAIVVMAVIYKMNKIQALSFANW